MTSFLNCFIRLPLLQGGSVFEILNGRGETIIDKVNDGSKIRQVAFTMIDRSDQRARTSVADIGKTLFESVLLEPLLLNVIKELLKLKVHPSSSQNSANFCDSSIGLSAFNESRPQGRGMRTLINPWRNPWRTRFDNSCCSIMR